METTDKRLAEEIIEKSIKKSSDTLYSEDVGLGNNRYISEDIIPEICKQYHEAKLKQRSLIIESFEQENQEAKLKEELLKFVGHRNFKTFGWDAKYLISSDEVREYLKQRK